MAQPNSTDRPPITCPHFKAIAGTRRCADYLSNGSCQRPDQFMCVEWLKLNSASKPPPAERDLFGSPVERPAPKPRSAPAAVTNPRPNLQRESTGTDTPLVRAVNEADVASFKASGLEVCLESETLGPIWLVSDYTEQDRQELKVEHAMIIAAVGSVFPNAQVTALRRLPKGQPKGPTAS